MGRPNGVRITLIAAVVAVFATASISPAHSSTNVVRAGDYSADLEGSPREGWLFMNDTVWGEPISVRHARSGVRIGRFALDNQGRLAWVERFAHKGVTWERIRVRSQAGSLKTVARHRGAFAVSALRFTKRSLRWTAGGDRHRVAVAVPDCQRIPGTKKVFAATRDVVLVEDEQWRLMACHRKDGRWRLIEQQSDGSHGTTVSGAAAAGSKVVVSTSTGGGGLDALWIVDVRTHAIFVPSTEDYPNGRAEAIDTQGRYIFTVFGGIGESRIRLVAGQSGRPSVVLDRADSYGAFHDVRIANGVAYWTSGEANRFQRLP